MQRVLSLQILSGLICLSFSSGLSNAASPPPTSGSPPQPTVSLGYATYSGVPFFDAVSNTTNTQFLGVRYAAPPTGLLRWAAPQPPQTTPGVQKAGEQPLQCWQAPVGAAAKTPFRDPSANGTVSARGMEILENRATPDASEDCLFLKYVSFLYVAVKDEVAYLNCQKSTVSSYLEAWDRRRTFPSYSGYMGGLINCYLYSTLTLCLLSFMAGVATS